MAQQTAVEWLVEQIIRKHPIITQFLPNYNFDKEIIEQAKQIEMQQHGNTWDESIKAHENRGNVIARSICDFDDYYNETYIIGFDATNIN